MFNTDSDFANLWDNTEALVASKGFENLPDGSYEAVVHSIRFEKSKSDKNMIAWDLIVNTGEYKGRHVFNNQFVSSPQSIAFVKGQFQRLGFDCSSFENVHKAFEQLLDCVVAISLKTTKGDAKYEPRQNVYVNKVLSKPDNSDPSLWK